MPPLFAKTSASFSAARSHLLLARTAALLLALGIAASTLLNATPARQDRPPRKVVVGTVVSGYGIFTQPLETRLGKMDEFVDTMAIEAEADPNMKRLDLAVLPETFLSRPGDTTPQQAVRIDEILPGSPRAPNATVATSSSARCCRRRARLLDSATRRCWSIAQALSWGPIGRYTRLRRRVRT
jgi:hypothetical protein